MDINYNFEGKSIGEVFNKTPEDVNNTSRLIAIAGQEMLDNYKEYTGEDENGEFMIKGKVLKRLLRDFPEYKDQVFVIAIFDGFTTTLSSKMRGMRAFVKLKDKMKELFNFDADKII